MTIIFFIILNSLAYAGVTRHCALSRSPPPNTTNYFLREEAACRRATPPVVRPEPLVALRGRTKGAQRWARPTTDRPPPHLPLPYVVTTGARARSCVTGARCQCDGPLLARPGGGARGAEPSPAARLLAPAALTSHLAADSCGTSERNIRPDNWRRKVKRV